MSFQVIVTGETILELKVKLAAAQAELDVRHGDGETSAPQIEEKAPKAKRKPKDPPPVEEELPEAAKAVASPKAVTQPVASPKAVTQEEVRAALQKVNSIKGMPAARELLLKFDCSRISELKEPKYKDFVQSCQQALG